MATSPVRDGWLRSVGSLSGIAAVAVGGLVRLWFWVFLSPDRMLKPDSNGYLTLAEDFPQDFVDGTYLSYRRTPGYPGYLALLGDSPRAATLVQVLVATAVIAGVLWWGTKLMGPLGGAAAAWVVALEPASIAYPSYVLTETVHMAVMLVGVVLVWKAATSRSIPSGLAGGAVLGLAALVRPSGMYLIPVLAIALLAVRRPLQTAAVLAAGAVVVGGWVVRNVAAEDLPALSTIDAENMLYYRAAGTIAVRDGRDWRNVRSELRSEMDAVNWANLGERWREEHRLGREIILDHPVDYVRASWFNFGLMAVDVAWINQLDLFPAWMTAIVFVPVYLAAAYGLWELWRRDRIAAVLIVSAIGYFVLLSFAPEAQDRFRIPFWPLLAVPAGGGIARLLSRPTRRAG